MTRASRVAGWTRASFRDLQPYYQAPLDGDPLRLDQNTHLLGPSPALQIRLDAASDYPTRDSDDLRAALAVEHDLHADHFVCGNGSDELLDILTKTFTEPGATMATTLPGYSLYPFYARLQGLRLAEVPLGADFRLDVDALLAAGAAITIVASPNNPTGNAHAIDDLERLLVGTDGIVVVDEAYIEYGGASMLPRVEEFDNLVVLRTFSKAYGLAALRIGWLAANRDAARALRLVKPPYNLSTFSEAVAIRALQERQWMQDGVAVVQRERAKLAAELAKRGFEPYASNANFILARSPIPPATVVADLQAKGILIRHFPGKATLEGCVRFTVGGPQHTKTLLAALDGAA